MTLLYIFSDGNCKGNGKKHARGGYSVYFGEELPFSQFNFTSLGGVTPIPTNNIMELNSILYIFKILSENPSLFKDINVIIVSDSQYSINAITKWSDNWIKNEWKNAKKQEVKNKELIKKILELKNKTISNLNVKFKHVFSHLQEPKSKESLEWFIWNGNNIVDTNINKMLETFKKS